MRASSKSPRVDSSSGAPPPPPPYSGDPIADVIIDLTATTNSPPSTSNVANIRRTLDTVMTIQAVHGQLLVDMLSDLQAL